MSSSQSLIIPQHDYDIFAPSWQAGVSSSQGLAKSLRKYDIESVNVAKTCEKLCLTMNENQNSPKDVQDADKQCAVRKSNIPFRAFSNIWFGTLKIYQQQVNTLLRLSKDLLTRSCNYELKLLEASKRKSSLKSHKLIKKRRLTLTESTEKSYFSTNYSELLDELEKLTQESKPTSVRENCSKTDSRSITQCQIREITIREISATIHYTPDVLDEDSGFGEATHEEIAEFFNFCRDNSNCNVRKTPTKRKSMSEQQAPIKQSRFIQDCCVEPEHNETTALIKDNLKTSPLKRSFVENGFMENIYSPANDFQQKVIDNNDTIEIIRIKTEHAADVEHYNMTKVFGIKRKKFKLIIDECTKIDTTEYIEEMKNARISAKLIRKRILKTYKAKKYLTALELLTRFNRRSLKLSLTLKQKIYVSREQFENEYLNLLRDIFKINYNEKLAAEIYPKWKCFNDLLQKANKTPRVNKLRNRNKESADESEADLNNQHEYLNTDVMNDNNNAIYNINQEIQNIKQPLNSFYHDTWCPYGVMLKLLNLWRFNQTNEIAATTLFKMTENRIDRALGFHSLLDLSKKQFVLLTNSPETIALQNVLMGKAIGSSITTRAAQY